MASRSSQLPLPLPHRPSLARDDLIVAPSNQLAVDAIDAWPNWPHPILYVHGPAGSGKSHLASSFAALSGAKAFDATEPFQGAEPFAAIVDDLDEGVVDEEALFGLLNTARLGRGSVLVTAKAPPSSLPLRLPDLASRLRAATVVAIGAPDEALLGGVLVKLFADRQMNVDQKLLAIILSRMERSLEAARDLVAEIDRVSLSTGRGVNRNLVLEVLAGHAVGFPEQSR